MPVTRFFSLVILTSALAGSLPAAAQTPTAAGVAPAATPPPAAHRHHHHHRKSIVRALEAVSLTAGQKQQVAAFRDQQRKADLNADSASKQVNAATLRRQIMGILTPDQKVQLAAAMQRHANRGAMPLPNQAATSGPPSAQTP